MIFPWSRSFFARFFKILQDFSKSFGRTSKSDQTPFSSILTIDEYVGARGMNNLTFGDDTFGYYEIATLKWQM